MNEVKNKTEKNCFIKISLLVSHIEPLRGSS